MQKINTFYDLIIIGGGAGGLTAAKVARGFGKKVAIVESNKLGGECTWTGCIPSKTLIKSAQIAKDLTNAPLYGLALQHQSIDTSHVMKHIRSVVAEIYATHTPEQLHKEGIDTYFGSYQFTDHQTIACADNVLHAKKYIIATGSSPFIPPIDGLADVPYLTNETIFNLEQLPKSLIILGGGAIGAELAPTLQRLGVLVTVIEKNQRMLMHDDQELVTILQEQITKEGVTLQLGLTGTRVAYQDNNIVITCKDTAGNEQIFKAEQILVAVGRQPNCIHLMLENAGVHYDHKGIKVDTTLRTTNKNIYACGDVVGPYQFSHMAYHQAVIAVKNAFLPFTTNVSYDNVIWVTFTTPELATTGLTEADARTIHGDKMRVYTVDYTSIDRAHTDRELVGKGKFICDKNGKLLGVHILGHRAGDIIHEAQIIKVKNIAFHKIASVIHAYPTYSELIWKASRLAYLDKLKRNIFIRLITKIHNWWVKK